MHDDDLLHQYKQDVETDYSATEEQRDKANEDHRFIDVDGGMWEGFLNNVFDGTDRPRFEFDIVTEAVQNYLGDWADNRFTVSYDPDDGAASEKDAEILAGRFRADMRRSNGMFAINNGVEGQSKTGVGAFRFSARYEDEGDPDNNNQVIDLIPIFSAYNTVLWDCAAKKMDKRDARHCTLLESYTEDSFKAAYPDIDPVSTTGDKSRSEFNWSNKKQIIVAERYEIEHIKMRVVKYFNPLTQEIETYEAEDLELIEDEMRQLNFEKRSERVVRRQVVKKSIFTGGEFIQKPKRIAGRYIPIVPIYGYWSYLDNQERYRGIVRKLKDPQRVFNVNITKMTETSATSPAERPIFEPSQVKGMEQSWLKGIHQNQPYALAKPLRNKDGSILHAGPLGYTKPSQLDQNTVSLVQLVADHVRQQTGGAPQDALDPEASGKAIRAVLQRVDLKTSTLTDNVRSALAWAGEVYRWMAKDVYGDPRPLKVLNEAGEPSKVNLFDMIIDEETGKPEIINDISRGAYEVVVKLGPSHQTQRQETREDLRSLLESLPQESPYYPVLLALILENTDGVGLDELKKFNRRMMLQLGIREPETDEEKAVVAALQQQQQSATDDLLTATAEKERMEAIERQSQAQQNLADAKLKGAKTLETIAKLGGISTQENIFPTPEFPTLQ